MVEVLCASDLRLLHLRELFTQVVHLVVRCYTFCHSRLSPEGFTLCKSKRCCVRKHGRSVFDRHRLHHLILQ